MSGLIDATGNRFGRLVVVGRVPNLASGHVTWSCVCDCGATCVVRADHLHRGATQSCGCLKAEGASRRNASPNQEPIPGERWMAVDGAYPCEISYQGRFRGWAGLLMDGWLDKNDYPMVSVRLEGGGVRSEFTHLLVARAFLGPPPDGKECDHIDRNRANPKLSNLRYLTHAENIENSANVVGEAHGGAKLTETEVREILAILPAPR